MSKKIPVIAFLHNDIKNLTFDKSEANPECRNKLEVFREKVSKGRLVQYWNNADELNGKVAVSLMKTTKMYPAIGWVRASIQTNTETLQEINDLRKKIDLLEREKNELQKLGNVKVYDIANLNELYQISGDIFRTYVNQFHDEYEEKVDSWQISITWAEIIATLAPLFISGVSDDCASYSISKELFRIPYPGSADRGAISEECFFTIKVQLLALGILDEESIKNKIWVLSAKGFQIMMNERAVKTRTKY